MNIADYENLLWNLFFKEPNAVTDLFLYVPENSRHGTVEGVPYREIDQATRVRLLQHSEIRLSAMVGSERVAIRLGIFSGKPYMLLRRSALFTSHEDPAEASEQPWSDLYEMHRKFGAEFAGVTVR